MAQLTKRMTSDDDSLGPIIHAGLDGGVQIRDDPLESAVEPLMELDALLDGPREVSVLRVNKLEV